MRAISPWKTTVSPTLSKPAKRRWTTSPGENTASVELEAKLTKFGFESSTAEDAVARLIDDGLQSDRRFVEAFVRSRINQGKGPAKIRADLREKGVDDSFASDGLQEAEQDWYALALDVRLKKFGPERPADFKEKARQMRFLQSRGFDPDHIQAAVSANVE